MIEGRGPARPACVPSRGESFYMSKKDCYGNLDRVFPRGREGLREVTPECLRCDERVRCLRAALETREGLEVRSEALDRAPADGIVERIRRWSQRKELSRRMKQEKEKNP